MRSCLKNCGIELSKWKGAKELCYLRAASLKSLLLLS